MIRFVCCVCAGVLLAAAGAAADTSGGAGTLPVAEIDGVKLTLEALASAHPNALFQMRNSLYDSERKKIDDLIDNYLLERRAREEHVSVSELLKIRAESATGKEPSEESLHIYYEGLDTTEPFEAVRDKILEHIHEKRIARARADYVKTLRDSAKVSILLEPPKAVISLKDVPARGSITSPVVLVEFADYECPYCQQVQPALDRMEAEYKGKIAFVYKDMPLPMHPHAQKASEAAACAGLQNKYWEYHDLLFKTKQLEVKDLKAAARQLGLDTGAFDACLDSGQRANAVKTTLEEAQDLGIQGTPTFFINGRFYSGNIPYEQLQKLVDDELNRSAGKAAAKTARHVEEGGSGHASLQ